MAMSRDDETTQGPTKNRNPFLVIFVIMSRPVQMPHGPFPSKPISLLFTEIYIDPDWRREGGTLDNTKSTGHANGLDKPLRLEPRGGTSECALHVDRRMGWWTRPSAQCASGQGSLHPRLK